MHTDFTGCCQVYGVLSGLSGAATQTSDVYFDPYDVEIHRSLMSRVFTPRKVAELEGAIRAYCAEFLDPLVGAERFDLISEFAAQMPMRVI